MSNEVYADSNEIACKAGQGKVIAAFPDVCLSPPSPPAGPIPVPYPDTSFSKDMQNGSKTVLISDKEVMLKDQSFYKTSPLGDEAATNGLGAGVVTHVITGKTYFVAWSMDVKFEGQNVDRHIDLTTSNHASPMANAAVPNPNLDAMDFAFLEDFYNQCACCGAKPRHAKGTAVTFDDWYGLNETSDGKPPAADSSNLTAKASSRGAEVEKAKARKASGCCQGKLFPEPPCNVFRTPVTKNEKKKIENAHKKNAPKYRKSKGMPAKSDDVAKMFPGLTQHEQEEVVKVNHRTPKNAGGCPTGEGNLQMHFDLCKDCQADDKTWGDWGGADHPTI